MGKRSQILDSSLARQRTLSRHGAAIPGMPRAGFVGKWPTSAGWKERLTSRPTPAVHRNTEVPEGEVRVRRIVMVAVSIAWMASVVLSGCSPQPQSESPEQIEKRSKMMEEHWQKKKSGQMPGGQKK